MLRLIKLFLLFLTYPSCHAFIQHHRSLKRPIHLYAAAAAATVTFDQVYFQHKTDWTRRLVSSEPRRQWALEDVSFHWESELVLLVGASSSGKSTALKLMCQQNDPKIVPTHGTVQVSSPPIYIGAGKLSISSPKEAKSIYERLAERPSLLQALDLVSCADKTSSQLSLSEQYKLYLAELCYGAPDAPILLLDEWLDNEPTSIVTAVEAALQSFVKYTNGVVVVVTHKTDRWKTQNRMELRSGKLVRHARP